MSCRSGTVTRYLVSFIFTVVGSSVRITDIFASCCERVKANTMSSNDTTPVDEQQHIDEQTFGDASVRIVVDEATQERLREAHRNRVIRRVVCL